MITTLRGNEDFNNSSSSLNANGVVDVMLTQLTCPAVMVLAVFKSLLLSEKSSDLHQNWPHDGELILEYADIFFIAIFYHILKWSS